MRPRCSANPTKTRCALLLGAILTTISSSAPVSLAAEPGSEARAPALALFDEARRLMAEGRYGEACPKLAESLRLVPGSGTRFNLAECYERSGKLASAWLLYREVGAEMARLKDAERESVCRTRMQALEPRISRLQIDVTARVEGLTISRDGLPVSEPLWGTPVPVDLGRYAVDVAAPSLSPHRYLVWVKAEGQTYHLKVGPRPRLQESAADGPTTTSDAEPDGGSALSTAGGATLGIGLGVAALGGVLLGVGYSNVGSAADVCSDRARCTDADAVDLGNEGRSTMLGGIVVTALGSAAALAGALMLVVSADEEGPAVPPAPDATARPFDGRADRMRLSARLGLTGARVQLDW